MAEADDFLNGENVNWHPRVHGKVFAFAALLALPVWSHPAAGATRTAEALPAASAAPNPAATSRSLSASASASASTPSAASSAFSAPAAPRVPVIRVPRTSGRITARELGLVINTADPYSVEVGERYIKARKLGASQVLRLALPVKPSLTPDELKPLAAAIEARFGAATQAVALAWQQPFAVGCNSITGALTLGYDAALCEHTCAPSRLSPYFNSATSRPFTDLKLRPTMLLAARDIAGARALIQRGVDADRSLGWRGAPPAHAYYVITNDRARSARAPLFPPPGLLRPWGVDVHVESTQAVEGAQRVLIYQTGLEWVGKLETLRWVPGALADHLTSYGGVLVAGSQMSALAWIASGATASYGTVSEPCAHPQKFPHPQALLIHYLQGSSAIEAYWKSVAWPQQGVFVGEPLAAPFARP